MRGGRRTVGRFEQSGVLAPEKLHISSVSKNPSPRERHTETERERARGRARERKRERERARARARDLGWRSRCRVRR